MKLFYSLALLSLIAGCAQKVPIASDAALFCDIEEKRIFTQAEIDWRTDNAPWNLRRDFQTNLSWERECETI